MRIRIRTLTSVHFPQGIGSDIMATQVARSIGRLSSNTCYFFLCDMQEKFRPSIRYFPEIITVAQRMVKLLLVLIVIHEV